ncbi:MAG TPA: Rieske 2Fe-2S domain-containing protein, partial [Steroidobacteraceae bacterium]|nr:Rieske 2Fe-2S domain-containing protein [Steroidobacteraceae bacterium]
MSATPARQVAESAAAPVARGLPAWVYNHPEMTRLELERLLKPSWQIACHISQIRNAGDYVTFELGADSVIVLRERGGGIRALRNVCRHRGTRLLEGAGR